MEPLFDLEKTFTSPVRIAAIDILRVPDGKTGRWFVRTTSTDGAVGIANANQRLPHLWPILNQLVAPYFIGQDARDLESLVDGVYPYRSNYKLAGLALWTCVASVELSVWDMLGKMAGRSVTELLGQAPGSVHRTEIPIYLSGLGRDTTPQEEVAWVTPRLEETQSAAIKLKIGGRMSHNADAAPGRTEALVALARQTWGDDITLYVDANGSYDAQHAIEVGRMLESYGIAFFEEPCPFDEYEQTRQVADALDMIVAGGEQDTSVARFRWMIENRGVDLVQPDIVYNGGFIRGLRVAKMAEAAGIQIAPHCPRNDPNLAYMLHFAAVVPNLGPHQEYNTKKVRSQWWIAPSFEARNGVITVPTGPGLGIEYDPKMWDKAKVVT
ncbi:MAG: mandelate racemase/muconate lactonizing enzyme family protein [Anaerolineae bacterium]|nr:mandelate racemase/muconate lactonizing enzyme family protein [Anaerolineae bacterium]